MLTRLAVPALILLASIAAAHAQDGQWKHGTGLTGEPKYPAGFAHFDYVDPEAPKGGLVRFGVDGAFDSFNPILDTTGNVAAGVGYLYDTLMGPSLDELNISAEYGLLAEAIKFPADHSSVTFRLRPEARWHDGQPVTAEDVVWSFEQTTKHNPNQRYYYNHVAKAEKTGEREVTFTFDAPGNRELPHIMGQLQVMPKHWWEGKDAQGRQRDIGRTTLEPPLGSGPYKIKAFEANRYVLYERVPDYWGKNLNLNVGVYNFDQVRFDSYRDSTVLIAAFKGDQYDWRTENSAKAWATEYKFPDVLNGLVITETFPDKASGVMQAFVPNLRREKFADPRVRLALNHAFDFEALKDTIFYGQYKRIPSYFAGTELASSGLPQGTELEILESVRDKLPPEVFTTPYTNPVNATPEAKRENLRKAIELMKAAGYELRGRQMVNTGTGAPFTFEMLVQDPSTERYMLPFKQDLARIGVTMTIRTVDTAQYIDRLRNRDFDMLVAGWGQSLSPGNEQRGYWGSKSASDSSSRNHAGISNPGVDALIDKVIYAKDRDELVAATKALDRVLLWGNYVVPLFYSDVTRTARWDRFGRPAVISEYTPGFPDTWWWQPGKAGVAQK